MTDILQWGGAMYDGVAFSDVGLLVTKVNIPLLPEVTVTEEDIDGYDGTVDVDEQYGPRPIELTVALITESEAEYQARLQQIASLFNAKKRSRPLVLSRAPGKRWMCGYNGRIPIEKVATIGEFTIPLKAYMPFAESITSSTEPLRLGQGYMLGQGLYLSDSSASYEIKTSPTTITVANMGTYKAYPKLVVKATAAVTKLSIENVTTSEKLIVMTTIAAGSELEIDCAPLAQICRINGSLSHGLVDGDFIRLDPGDNELLITADGAVAITLAVDFRHLYLY